MNLKQPDWWSFSSQSWQQLIELMSSIQPSSLTACANRASWQLLRHGDTNANFKLTLPHQDYFVQLVDNEKVHQLPGRHYYSQTQWVTEHQVLSKWLPKCLLDRADIRIANWIYATPTPHQQFNQPVLIKELCQLLTELHRSDLPFPVLNIHEHLERYYEIAKAHQPQQADKCQSLYQEASTYTAQFSAACCCHNDISPGNLLSGHQLFLVDWEYAAISDPVFELAGIIYNFELSEVQEATLIEEYQKQSEVLLDKEKLDAMKSLYRIISELWYMGNEKR